MQRLKFFVLVGYVAMVQQNLQAQPRELSPVAMQHDLAVLESSWTNMHPGLYRYNSPAQVKSYFLELRQACRVSMKESRFYLLLSQLTAKIKCGHTFLNPTNLDDSIADRLFAKKVIPLFFRVAKGKFIITHNLSDEREIKKGDEILAINDVPVAQIIKSLLTVSRSDGQNALGKQLDNINETPDEGDKHSLFDIYFPLFYPPNDSNYRLVIRHYGQTGKYVITLPGISLKQRMEQYEKLFGPVPTAERSWDYRLLNEQTAYMKFGTFAFWNSAFKPKQYIDSVFTDLLARPGIRHLIIDIRGNEGGDNSGDYILSYLTDKKIGCSDPDHRYYRFLAVPDTLVPYLYTWDKSFKKPKDSTQYFKNEIGLWELKKNNSDCITVEPQPALFRGKVYLLIDSKNSSAGYEMARDFKALKIGTLIGETTGGSQQGINGSEFFFLRLPGSGFEVDLPLVYNYQPGKPDKGIDPDHLTPYTQKDISAGKDAALEQALYLVRKSMGKVPANQ